MNFTKLNNKILDFISDYRDDSYAIDDNNFKLPLSDAIFCAEDTIRNKKFYQGIKKAIQDFKNSETKEINVIDAWSGTGILWIFALYLWASQVVFIEHNPYSLELNKKLVESLWLSDRASFCEYDATEIILEKKYDLLISETITIDFSKEDFHRIIKNLKKYMKWDYKILPEWFEIEAILKDNQDNKIWKSKININSYKDLNPKKIILPKRAKKIELSGKVNLYGKDIFIHSGESMSFFNKYEVDIKCNDYVKVLD